MIGERIVVARFGVNLPTVRRIESGLLAFAELSRYLELWFRHVCLDKFLPLLLEQTHWIALSPVTWILKLACSFQCLGMGILRIRSLYRGAQGESSNSEDADHSDQNNGPSFRRW